MIHSESGVIRCHCSRSSWNKHFRQKDGERQNLRRWNPGCECLWEFVLAARGSGGSSTTEASPCGLKLWNSHRQRGKILSVPPFADGKALGDEGSTQDHCREQRTALGECPRPCYRVLHMQLPQTTPEMNPNPPARAQHRICGTDSTEKCPSASQSAQQTHGEKGNPWCSSQW